MLEARAGMLEAGLEADRPTVTIKQEDTQLGDIMLPCGPTPDVDQIRRNVVRREVVWSLKQELLDTSEDTLHRDMEMSSITKSSVFKEAQELISQNCMIDSFMNAACEKLQNEAPSAPATAGPPPPPTAPPWRPW